MKIENSESIKIKRKHLRFIFAVVSILIVLIIFRVSASNETSNVSAISNQQTAGKVIDSQNNGNVQVVKLTVQGAKYILEPSIIKVGVPVRIEGDLANMPGCSKSVIIQAFNIRKNLIPSDNVIEFTPDKSGTFNIACSMNMYRGTFTVLDSSGAKTNYVEPAQVKGPSCGGGSGGCGCGGF